MGAGAGGVMEALDEKPKGEEEDLEDLVPVDEPGSESSKLAPEEKPSDDLGLPPDEGPSEKPAEPEAMGEPEKTEEPTEPMGEKPPMEEPPVEEPMSSEAPPEGGQPQTYLVVYDVTGDERDEIFRNGSNNAVKSFKAFYEDTFKAAMKSIIQEYKEKKEQAKVDAEKKEQESKKSEKNSKLHKFLGKIKE